MSWTNILSAAIPAVVNAGATAYAASQAQRAAGQQSNAIRDAMALQDERSQVQRDYTDDAYGFLRNNLLRDFETSPGYEFRRSEGMRGIEGSAAARGLLGSGGTLQALTRYNNNLAGDEYGNYINRLLASTGLAQPASTGATNAITSLQGALGTAQATGTTGAANAYLGGANNMLAMYAMNPKAWSGMFGGGTSGDPKAGWGAAGWGSATGGGI